MTSAPTTNGQSAARAPQRGRPRSASADRAILDAALKLLVDLGYARMSVEAVAAEAKVGKTTIYRRYPSKPDMAAAAVLAAMRPVEALNTGSLRGDLLAYVKLNEEVFLNGPGLRIAALMITEQSHHPDLFKTVQERLIIPRRASLKAAVERGIQRGEVRPDVDIDVVIDMIANAMYGLFFSGRKPYAGWAESVVDSVLRGIRT